MLPRCKNLRCLAVTNSNKILVVHLTNKRILSLSSSLCSVKELDLPVDGGLQSPLAFDEVQGRLYVGESDQVMVFDGVGF